MKHTQNFKIFNCYKYIKTIYIIYIIYINCFMGSNCTNFTDDALNAVKDD